MDFELTAEQQLLRDTVTEFLATRYDLEQSRAAARLGAGWQPEIWHALAAEVGILGAGLPDSAGGFGGGPVETMIIAEALGAALVVEPYVDTVVLGGGLLRRAGGERAASLLRGIVSGEVITAFAALEEDSGYDVRRVSTSARREGDSWVLDGAKTVVTTAPLATHLLVTARTADAAGLSLFVVAAGTPGLTLHPYRTIDDRSAADVLLDGVRVPADALLGTEGGADDSLARAVDEAVAAIAAEAVGGMRRVLADTVDYAKQRRQFGVPIGSFQVLAHRLVDMHLELEQSIAATYLVTLKLDADPTARARAAAAAKATIGRAARFIGQHAVQLHGAMGMTEELAIGHYFKRLTAIQYEWGTTDQHIARYAALRIGPAVR
ncbi:acyl-CoA dehydrogenase family protein [Nocardia terpenica]|uniref:acyl-CoA dehydrogenase family protein n=1 Tax=Nocardia terpenica TaxID=455432 RepID=UPI00189623E8|nr:acyl-CoA dehydrogenase [Nocardia terpenica]MBF6066302.1 acyl-CoA dehydrogenase family protein [Nocardia terpenica]MBF6108568.1 acyl-CoA dehydrogenase family protein [Nocardia terpenica]MBF6116114.1 acyl-CoA dehydrogenase family protein [Nocardia terpenica]MBF6123765.1 acyl-CoA dehydrogenase family protein [Nocardia terpenica]MBF6157088.1 acyl-CoA dehydrogenase family protein [Nocardia terpenica]